MAVQYAPDGPSYSNASSGGMSAGQGAAISGGLQAAGGLLGGLAAGQATKDAQKNALLMALLQMNQQNQIIGLQSTQMDPLAQQRSRQHAALQSALMGQAQNAQTTNGVRTGGIMGAIPQGGFGAQTQAFFSPGANAAAEGNFMQAAAPFAKPGNLQNMGYDAQSAALPQQQANAAYDQAGMEQDQQKKIRMQALQQALGGHGGGGGSKWWKHLLAGVAGVAAGVITANPGVGIGVYGAADGALNH